MTVRLPVHEDRRFLRNPRRFAHCGDGPPVCHQTVISSDPSARPLPEGPAAPLQGAFRALDDPDLRRQPALRQAHRPLRRQCPDRCIFETYVEKELAPTLDKGDVVILDNLAAHKSKAAEKAIKARGAWILFLPL